MRYIAKAYYLCVDMINTKHSEIQIMEPGKIRKNKKKDENVIKPKCITDYNFGMNRVDSGDQQLACFSLMGNCMEGYKKYFSTYYRLKSQHVSIFV